MEIAINFGYNNKHDQFRQNVTGRIYHHITCISLGSSVSNISNLLRTNALITAHDHH